MTILKIGDLAEQVMAEEETLRRQIYVEDGHIVINISYEYNIPLSGCDTPERILHWVWHLTEKTWMTQEVSRRFIELACHENGLPRPVMMG